MYDRLLLSSHGRSVSLRHANSYIHTYMPIKIYMYVILVSYVCAWLGIFLARKPCKVVRYIFTFLLITIAVWAPQWDAFKCFFWGFLFFFQFCFVLFNYFYYKYFIPLMSLSAWKFKLIFFCTPSTFTFYLC